MSYTKELYNKIKGDLGKELKCSNVMEVPRLSKIVLNSGFKAGDADNNFLKYIVEQISLIAGQKPVLTKARKSIAGFKLRENSPIGCKVTLRGDKMYEFIDRLVHVALPRVRDFRGLSSKNFNQSGHYTFGIKEHSVFPEINLDKAYKNIGLTITVVTTTKEKEGCKLLLKKLGFPIK